MNYPLTIIDDFFEDPDGIVEIANSLQYTPTEDGRWPGARTPTLSESNPDLFAYLGNKIHNIFYMRPFSWRMMMHFQKIQPFHENVWNKKNRGWVHQDPHPFGGIIYLNKNPEINTGTSIFRVKKGFARMKDEDLRCKESLYLEQDIPQEQYDSHWDNVNNQFIETITVENVYNRLLLFDGSCYHGVKTFGSQERLTLNFFGLEVGEVPFTPLQRMKTQ